MMTKYNVLAAALAFCLAGTVDASTVTVGTATAPVGGGATTPTQIDVNYIGDADVVGFQCYVTTPAGVTATAVTPAANCNIVGSGDVKIVAVNDALDPLESGVKCSITYTVGAGASDGDVFPLVLRDCEFSDVDFNPIPVADQTLNDGSITVTAGPPPDSAPDLSPNPADGSTTTLPVVDEGNPSCMDIAISATGGNGNTVAATVTCTGAVDVAVTGGGPLSFLPGASSQSVHVCVTATDSAQTFPSGVTCSGTDGSGAIDWAFNLEVPAGNEPPALAGPTVGAPTAGPINPVSGNGTVTFPVADPGDVGGPDATVECSVTSGDFTISPDPTTLTFPAGSSTSQAIGFSCNPQPTGAYTGTLSCTGAFAGDVGLTCPEFTAAPPPHLVPATSLWSKLALFGLFGALGMLILGLRRSH